MTLNDIINLLRGARRTAAEYRQAAASINLGVFGETVEATRAKRDALLLRGSDGEIEAMEAEVRGAQRDADRARVAKAELERMAVEAAEREREVEVERAAQQAKATQQKMLEHLVELDAAAARVAELLVQLRVGREFIQNANKTVADAGRPDLKTMHALSLVAEHVGVAVDSLPRFDLWHLHGYTDLPSLGPAADTPAHPKSRRLGRAAELLSRPSRAKAV